MFRVARNPLDPTQDQPYRRLLARYDVDALRRLGETALRHFPSRRVQP